MGEESGVAPVNHTRDAGGPSPPSPRAGTAPSGRALLALSLPLPLLAGCPRSVAVVELRSNAPRLLRVARLHVGAQGAPPRKEAAAAPTLQVAVAIAGALATPAPTRITVCVSVVVDIIIIAVAATTVVLNGGAEANGRGGDGVPPLAASPPPLLPQ